MIIVRHVMMEIFYQMINAINVWIKIVRDVHKMDMVSVLNVKVRKNLLNQANVKKEFPKQNNKNTYLIKIKEMRLNKKRLKVLAAKMELLEFL